MPRVSHIVHRRQQRLRRQGHGGRSFLKVALLLLLGGLLIASLFTGLTVTLAALAVDSISQQLPDFNEIERLGEDSETTFETTKIYAWGDDPDNDGYRDLVLINEVIDPLGGDRQWMSLDQIPQSLIDATVAIEDKTFWTNQGFDLQGMR